MTTVSHAQTREVQIAWLTWAQVVTKYGKKEGLARLKRGSLKFRKSPTDSKFMEFCDLTETNKHAFAKLRQTMIESKGKKQGQGMLQNLDELSLDNLQAEDFDVDGMDLDIMDLDPAVKTIIEEQGNKDDGSNSDEDSLCNNIIRTVIPALNLM